MHADLSGERLRLGHQPAYAVVGRADQHRAQQSNPEDDGARGDLALEQLGVRKLQRLPVDILWLWWPLGDEALPMVLLTRCCTPVVL